MKKILPFAYILMASVAITLGIYDIAHAQGVGDPVTQATTSVQTGWDMVRQFGPIWGGMLLTYGVLAQVVKAGFFQKLVGKRLAGTVALVGVFGSVLEAHFGSGSWAGVVVTAIAALKMLVNPTVQPTLTPAVTKSTLASMLIGAVLLGGSLIASCGPNHGGAVTPVINGAIDCTIDNGGQIASLLASLRPQPGQKVDWHNVYLKAKAAGATIGGCVIAQLVQDYMTNPNFAAQEGSDSWDAYGALEKFRLEEAHGATFHTSAGDL